MGDNHPDLVADSHRQGGWPRRDPTVAGLVRLLALALLVLAGCSSGGLTSPAEDLASRDETPESTFGYTIGLPPDGYELCAVTVPSALSLRSDETAILRVYGDATADDPYEGPLYGIAVFDSAPLDGLFVGQSTETTDATVDGVPALIGGGDSVQLAALPPDAARAIVWGLPDGRTAQVVVRNDADADLVAIAEAVSVDGATASIAPEALPVEPVDLGDLYLLEGRPQFRFSVDYQLRGDDGDLDDQLTLFGVAGDSASLEALRFRAAESRRVEIEGSIGIVADVGVDGDGPWLLRWMPEEGIILQMLSFRLGPDELVALEASVTKVGNEAWTGLVDELDPGVCAP